MHIHVYSKLLRLGVYIFAFEATISSILLSFNVGYMIRLFMYMMYMYMLYMYMLYMMCMYMYMYFVSEWY